MSCTIPTRSTRLTRGENTEGCSNFKECVQINNELDTELNKIKILKRKYNLDNFSDTQQMYMINPNKDCNQSRNVRPDPMMYMLDMSAEARCDNPLIAQQHNRLPKQFDPNKYNVNPNAGNDFTTEEEQYVMFPKSNIPVRKSDLKQKRKIRIYPHMFPQLNPNTEDEADGNKLDFGKSIGGVDYPIPMRFQMRYLQDRGHASTGSEGHGGVDYDLRLKHRSKTLPRPSLAKDLELRVSDNVDFERTRSVNGAIISGQFLNKGSKVQRFKHARTIGAPRSDHKNLTCSQQARNLEHSRDVAIQPIEWYRSKYSPESSFYTDCEGCPKEQRVSDRQADLLKPMSKQERNVFGTKIDRRRPAYQTYPSQAAMKTSFFGLGPAIPPPNPLLLSNVPSNLLLSRTTIVDPERSSIQHPGQQGLHIELSDDNIDATRGRETRPFDPNIETFVGEGPFDQASVLSTGPSGQATPMSQIQSRIRPAPAKIPNNTEYSRRNKSLETDLQDKINKVVEQQRQILMQISDIRHLVPNLKQRELIAKNESNIQDISYSINKFGNSIYLLNQIRQIQSFLQKQQKRLLQRLEDVMPGTEFLKYQTKLQNRIAFYQNEVKRYHEMPADNAIQAFTKQHFEGDPHIMKAGFYNHPHMGGLGNNRLGSLKIGKDVSVILYDRANRRGKVLVYHGPRRIPNMPVLWADNISGIEVLKKITIQVQLFDAPFYQGGNVRVGPGFYDYPDVAGIKASNLKSMVIPKGLHVKLYSRPSKKGETVDFLGPQRLSFLPSGWSKKVFGIEITQKTRDY